MALLAPIPAQASFLRAPVPDKEFYWPGGGTYYRPNEHAPVKAKALYERGAPGVHLSVGTERGFIGFAMNPNASHLLLTDVDSKVLQFNRVNIALLKLAENLDDYRQLRFRATDKEWKARVAKAKHLTTAEKKLLGKGGFTWWKQYVREDRKFLRAMDEFAEGGHYLSHEKMFTRIHTAAREDKIQAIFLNLADKTHLAALAEELKRKRLALGLLDPSNAWVSHTFMEGMGMNNLVAGLKGVTHPEAVVVATRDVQVTVGFHRTFEFEYRAFPWQELRNAAKRTLPLSYYIREKFSAKGDECAASFAKMASYWLNPWK